MATAFEITESAAARPKVLFVSHETTLTGAPIQLLHLVRWLHGEGWELLVATPESGPISDLLAADGIPLVIHPGLLVEPGHAKLRELAAQYDVVVANTIISWAAVRAAHLEGKRVIWYLHETLVAVRLIRQIPEIGPTLELATLLVTPTRQTARILEGVTHTPIEVVPYGIPEVQAAGEIAADGRVTFVTAASVEPRKGQDILVAAIKKLPAPIREAASFKVVGRHLDPPFVEKVKESAAGLSNIEFTGERSHAQSLELLAASDSLICPSRDETMPITILEAMSLGKVIISADVGGIAEWLRDEMNGLLVPPEDPEALAHAIERCITDRQLATRLGAGARRTFERHFTLGRFAAHFGRLLMEASPKEQAPQDWSIATGYHDWMPRFDTADAVALRRDLRHLRRQPLISILVPVYNPDLQLLEAAIESIQCQLYKRWELCLADDASTDPAIRPFLEEKARQDDRIKLIFREKNGHISACTNSALQIATGEWCALLDQDDLVSQKALAFVALEIEQHPDAGLIYSDEDKIEASGARSNPFLKTDWNPELFLGQNYINHLGVYRTSLLREIGGFREGFEGSQDYDLALRCIERLKPAQIRHIPRILYHWRAVAGSLAAVVDAKPYAKEAARRAIADHLKRRGVRGRVEPCPENVESHRVVYDLPDPAPTVSIVVPTRDRVGLLKQCLSSIRDKTDYPSIEFVIVDNGSTEPATLKFLSELEQGGARVLRDNGDFNFSRLINLGVATARGEVLAFLNNDIEANEPGWLREMVSHVVRVEVGAVGARLWYPDGTLQHGGVILGLGGVAGHAFPRVPHGHPGYFNRAFLQQNYSAVTGACLLVRKEVFEEIGGFDETNLAISFNDVDFCLRLQTAGFQNVWTPYANLIHHESASRGHQRAREEQMQFVREATFMQRKWGIDLLSDPFYNPNLTLHLPGFELAVPPRLPEFAVA